MCLPDQQHYSLHLLLMFNCSPHMYLLTLCLLAYIMLDCVLLPPPPRRVGGKKVAAESKMPSCACGQGLAVSRQDGWSMSHVRAGPSELLPLPF
eukprot:353438-Chlamydomonas_euryale.AAC.2